ncbi:MAG TPA: TetR family transcriptional regulator [Pseudonocardiaceae bacterium]|jgi:AcrR family transcriptional regulator
MTSVSPKRPRDAAATRAAILASAHALFTASGYDGVGVREIASGAGVTAMLVNRYFGSKEQLFAEVVDTAFAPRTVVGADSHGTAVALAARTAPGAEHLDPFLLMLRSASNPRAAEIMRAATIKHVGADLLARLDGPDADARTELALGLIAGTWLMRKVIGTPALSMMSDTALAEHLEGLFALLYSPDQ